MRATTSISRMQPRRRSADQLEQLVADRVAERVVDALEVVEVEAKHREALAALDALDLVLELFAQQRAVWQVGQRVMARHVRDSSSERWRSVTSSWVASQPPPAIGLLTTENARPSGKFTT